MQTENNAAAMAEEIMNPAEETEVGNMIRSLGQDDEEMSGEAFQELSTEVDPEFVKKPKKEKKDKIKAAPKVKTGPKPKAEKKAPKKEPKWKPEVPTEQQITIFENAGTMMHVQSAAEKALKIISGLKDLTDQQVRDLYIQSDSANKVMFVINGAMSYEIYRRVEASSKFMNRKGQGVNSVFTELATDLGIAPSTLYADFKIFQEFGPILEHYLKESPESLLPREYYSLAVKTGDMAIKTMEYFEQKRESSGYTTMHARRDTKLINSGISIDVVDQADLDERKQIAQTPAVSVNADKSAAELIEPMLKLQIHKTMEAEGFLGSIVEDYGSFESWFLIRCREEFGAV